MSGSLPLAFYHVTWKLIKITYHLVLHVTSVPPVTTKQLLNEILNKNIWRPAVWPRELNTWPRHLLSRGNIFSKFIFQLSHRGIKRHWADNKYHQSNLYLKHVTWKLIGVIYIGTIQKVLVKYKIWIKFLNFL